MTKPITPAEVAATKVKIIPDDVIKIWNDLIAKNFNTGRSTVLQTDAVAVIAAAQGISRDEVFQYGYLGIEELYRANGWQVDYDKPGYNESYEAFFVFTAHK